MKNSKLNSMDEKLEYASKLYKAKKYEKALPLYVSLAEEGLTDCQTLVCYMYMKGEGIPIDLKKAFYWCKKAAASNNPEGRFYLGKVYAKEGDWNETIQCYKEAAMQNYSPAIYCLARIYYLGKVVAQDKNKALKMMEKACSMGHLVARREYGKMLILGQEGILAIPKGIFLIITLPFVAFRTVKGNLDSEKARI